MAVTNEFQGYIWFSEKLRPPEGLKIWLLQAQNRVITSWKDVPGAKVGNSIDFKLSYIAINHNSSFVLDDMWHGYHVTYCLITM